MNGKNLLLLSILLVIVPACNREGQIDTPTPSPTLEVAGDTAVPATEVPPLPTNTAVASTPTTPPATATTAPTHAPEATATIDNAVVLLTEDGEEVQFIPPSPDGIQVLLANVEAGRYTLPEAVIAALQHYSGEEPTLDLFGEQARLSLDGWRLSSLAANAYANASPAEQAEIEQLYNKIVPSPELLEAISAPAMPGNSRRDTHIAKARAQTDCLRLWREGFPEGERTLCLLYLEFSEAGHTYRVYYPEARHSDETFLPYAQAAADALRDSVRVYGEWSELRDINLIFTLLTPPEEEENDAAAFVPVLTAAEIRTAPCPILVLPLGLDGPADDGFKQLIAHEVFHCVQYWRQEDNTGASADWYIEGMAEYFSGVVYPNANNEHQYLGGFNFFTASESILDLQYSSWVFFQYLGDRFGKEFVVNMLDVLPTSGGKTAQAAALAGIGDMSTVFHEFGRAFLDRQLRDENGNPLPLPPYYLPPSRFVLNPGSHQLQATPFQLARYQLTYREAKEYAIELETSASAGRLAARPASSAGTWGDLPLEIRVSCDDVVYVGLVTNTDAASDYSATAQTEWVDLGDVLCDPCLVGTWMQDTAVIEENFRMLAAGANVVAVRGQFFLVIDENSMTFTPQGYGVQIENDGEVVDFAIEGSSASTYIIPAEGQILASQGAFDFTATFTGPAGTFTTVLGPEAMSMIPSPLSFGPTDPLDPGSVPSPGELGGGETSTATELIFGYECTENTLTTFPPPGLSPITSSTYVRVSGSAP